MEPDELMPSVTWTWRDRIGTAAGRPDGMPGHHALHGEGIGCALISMDDRSVRLREPEGADEATVAQWIADQAVPRILAHLGEFVVHAGAVQAGDGRVALFLGPTGRGKSTLTGFLHREGWTLLGDDAARLSLQDGQAVAGALYRRLKLLPDSWNRLFPEPGTPPILTGRKVSVDLDAVLDPVAPRPVAAIFRIDMPGDTREPVAHRLSGAETCMELVRESFALDPTDRGRAAHRLPLAAAVAAAAPGFALSYPRDFAQLGRVRDLVAATLDRTAHARLGP